MKLNEYSDSEIYDEFNNRNLKSKGDYILYITNQTPSYSHMNDQLINWCGSFQGGPGDVWTVDVIAHIFKHIER